jgi:hypothetical protein
LESWSILISPVPGIQYTLPTIIERTLASDPPMLAVY